MLIEAKHPCHYSLSKQNYNFNEKPPFCIFPQAEIIDKCNDNIRCLKTIIHSSGGAIVPHRRVDDIRGEFNYKPQSDCGDLQHFLQFVGNTLLEFAEFVYSNWPLSNVLLELFKCIRIYRILPIYF